MVSAKYWVLKAVARQGFCQDPQGILENRVHTWMLYNSSIDRKVLPQGDVTLINLQRQLAMIRCCAKNRSSVTHHCGRFFCDICSAATRWKLALQVDQCNTTFRDVGL